MLFELIDFHLTLQTAAMENALNYTLPSIIGIINVAVIKRSISFVGIVANCAVLFLTLKTVKS
jgi:hypothetical protein